MAQIHLPQYSSVRVSHCQLAVPTRNIFNINSRIAVSAYCFAKNARLCKLGPMWNRRAKKPGQKFNCVISFPSRPKKIQRAVKDIHQRRLKRDISRAPGAHTRAFGYRKISDPSFRSRRISLSDVRNNSTKSKLRARGEKKTGERFVSRIDAICKSRLAFDPAENLSSRYSKRPLQI